MTVALLCQCQYGRTIRKTLRHLPAIHPPCAASATRFLNVLPRSALRNFDLKMQRPKLGRKPTSCFAVVPSFYGWMDDEESAYKMWAAVIVTAIVTAAETFSHIQTFTFRIEHLPATHVASSSDPRSGFDG